MRKWFFIAAVMVVGGVATSAHAREQAAIDGQGRLHVFALAYAYPGGPTKVIQYAYFSGGTWNIRRLPGALKEAPVVATNSQGTIYVAGVGTDNAIYFTRGSGDYFAPWTYLGGVRGSFSTYDSLSAPSIGVNQDGRIEIFVTGTDHYAYHTWETCTGCGTFNGWWDWINYSGYHQNDDPAVELNSDGRLEIFVSPSSTTGIGVLPHSNILGHVWQDIANGGWNPTWENFSSPDGTFYAQPVVARNQDGRLEVFIWTDNGISHRWQVFAGGWWSDWAILTPATYDMHFAVARDVNGNLMIFVEYSRYCSDAMTQYDPPCYAIEVLRQVAPNSYWEPYWSDANFEGTNKNPYAATVSDAISTADGRMHVFAYDYYDLRMKHVASNPILDVYGQVLGHSWSNSWEQIW